MAEPNDFTDEERALFDRLNIGKAGGLPLPSFIRPSEVVAQARPMADAILADYASLRELVTPHETLLFDRWKSLKKRKRRDLLQSAWTSAAEATASVGDASPATAMPLPHRPDLVAWRRREREKGQQLKDSSANGTSSFAAPENLVTLLDWTADDRAAFLWPHVNIDDLAHRNTRALWLLATSRASVPPEAFAATDLDTTRLGKACLALLPRYLNQYSMLFTGRTTPETYGRLYTWEELKKLAASEGEKDAPGSDSFAARGTHPGEGLWILTIQARLYRFLVLAVRSILGSSVDSANGNGTDKTTAQKSVLDEAASPYTDGPLTSLESAYRIPPTSLDLQALLDLAYAKVFEAEDHIWALRTDPAYFRSTLQAWAVHRKDRLADVGNDASSADTPAAVTPAVVDACLRRALEQAETWNLVYSKVSLLAQQMEKNADAVAEAQEGGGINASKLPRDVLLSFYALYYHIRSFENEPVGLLQTGAFSSPALRKHYRLETETDKDGKSKTTVVAAEGEDAPPIVGDESEGHGAWDFEQARAVAIWALTGLQDDATRQLFGRQTLLDELETAVRTLREGPANDNEVLPPWVTDQVATLALYARCTTLLDRFQPWAAAYDQTVQQDTEIRDILTMDFHMSMGRLRALLEHSLGVSLPSFVTSQGSATKVDEEKQLKAFWATVYLALEEHKALTPRLKEMLTRADVDGELEKSDKMERSLSSGARADRRVVDRRAARVFRALFHDPGAHVVGGNGTPATLTWPDVVHALKVAGFGGERLYANAWLFVPGQVAKMAAIVAAAKGAPRRFGSKTANGKSSTTPRPSLFHEPTGNRGEGGLTKLTPSEARWIGKRLTRAYGWDVTTFAAE
ncbi:hypothetical protein SEUCBS140593_006335 [Sporothrix eucalyptigena]|uniref:Uncharacterized protein n=1 Tax=Sporothrix eucalyptigena TaxID=1812306 RepID=A0ABP0C4H9_9PEZI